MAHRDFDRMRISEPVQFEGLAVGGSHELRPDIVLGEQMVHTQELHKRGIALVQPKMRPPFLKMYNLKVTFETYHGIS